VQKQEVLYSKGQLDKLGNALIFLCKNLEKPTKTHLLKLIFIIEEISIVKFGVPFFDLRFDVWKLGPVSKDLFVELTDEPNLLEPYILKQTSNGTSIISAKKDFSDDEFSDNEMSLLHEIVERFKYCTANELINFTHKKNSLWYNAAQRNGVLDLLESGKMTTTNIEINMAELIEDDEEKFMIYNGHKEFLTQSKSLKF
jgi:uncharacterized phage-associated protein